MQYYDMQDIERENSSSVTSEAEESGENDFGRAAALSVPLAAFRFVTRLASVSFLYNLFFIIFDNRIDETI